MNHERIGEKYISNDGDKFEIIGIKGVINNRTHFLIKFESGFITHYSYGVIKSGKVKDCFKRTLCGVGYLGHAKRKGNEKIYSVWMNMLKRCYDKNSPAYKYYGGKGVYVDERWHSFEMFLFDFRSIEGYNVVLFEIGELQLDKDIRIEGNKIYSLETCKFVNKITNYQHRKYKLASEFIATSPEGEMFEGTNLTKFCKERNIHAGHAHEVMNGKLNKTSGWSFERKGVVCNK